MVHKIDRIELNLPDCMVSWPPITQDKPKLTGFSFLINFGTAENWTLNYEETLGHYFFDNPSYFIPHAALAASFCDIRLDHEPELYWIKADPVQYSLDINQGYIIPCDISPEHSDNVINKINLFLSQDNLACHHIDQDNWVISSQKPINYMAPSLLNIINQSISFNDISGQDKTYWQKLSAELQLLLRQHKANEQDPDGVYFWGAGALPKDRPIPTFSKIISNDYDVLGLAKLAGVSFHKLEFSKITDLNIKDIIDKLESENILISTQDFTRHWRTGNVPEFEKLSRFFDEMILALIKLVKNRTLGKLVLNTGDKKYSLTKKNIVKSYFRGFLIKWIASLRSQ
jgi:hypothetical protein